MEPTAYLWLKFKELQANLTGPGEVESFKLEYFFFSNFQNTFVKN